MLDATAAYRRRQQHLRALTLQDLLLLWPLLDPGRLDQTLPRFLLAAHALIVRDRLWSAGIADRYLDEAALEQGHLRAAPGTTPERLPAELVATAVRVTSLVTLKQGLARGLSRQDAANRAFVRTGGAVTRLVADAGSSAVLAGVQADPGALAYRRVTDGSPCAFCALMASRGAVYKTRDSAVGLGRKRSGRMNRLNVHDYCGCVPEPIYSRDLLEPTSEGKEWDELYTEATREGGGLAAFRSAYYARYGRT